MRCWILDWARGLEARVRVWPDPIAFVQTMFLCLKSLNGCF